MIKGRGAPRRVIDRVGVALVWLIEVHAVACGIVGLFWSYPEEIAKQLIGIGVLCAFLAVLISGFLPTIPNDNTDAPESSWW